MRRASARSIPIGFWISTAAPDRQPLQRPEHLVAGHRHVEHDSGRRGGGVERAEHGRDAERVGRRAGGVRLHVEDAGDRQLEAAVAGKMGRADDRAGPDDDDRTRCGRTRPGLAEIHTSAGSRLHHIPRRVMYISLDDHPRRARDRGRPAGHAVPAHQGLRRSRREHPLRGHPRQRRPVRKSTSSSRSRKTAWRGSPRSCGNCPASCGCSRHPRSARSTASASS